MLSTARLNQNLRITQGCLKEVLNILFTNHNTSVHSSAHLLLLHSCTAHKVISEGKRNHSDIYDRILVFTPDTLLPNTLINMYDKCGSLMDARKVFDYMSTPDVYSWNMIIAAYRRHGLPQEALALFHQMQRTDVQPDHFTFSTILPVCSNMASLDHGLQIHGKLIRYGFQTNVIVKNTLIDLYAKCGSIHKAYELFDKMTQRSVVSWTAMIVAYEQNSLVENSLEIFKQMQLADVELNSATFSSILPACAKMGALDEGMEIHRKVFEDGFSSDVVVVTALIDMYAKCGNLQKAHELFDGIPQQDVVSWTAIVAGYVQNGFVDKALEIFKHMQLAGVKPNATTFASILPACAKMGALEQGYGMHGYCKEAHKLFELMKHSQTKPNRVSFICVLFAYSHAGMVADGCKYFNLMSDSYCIIPTIDHYVCIVDLITRAGYLEEALNFIIKMPIKPDLVVWMCLLGACRSHKSIALGEFVAGLLFGLDCKKTAPYVLLSNIYSEAGRWSDAQQVRKFMSDRGVEKIPGCSWVEVHKMVHTFCVGDRSHPQTPQIYAKLDELFCKMKEAGYIPDTRPVLNDVEEEEKELILVHHSEKLAIAFGLLNTSPGTTLRVVKNLRVCADCHSAIKFISTVVAREIVVRDANRFHHFKNGQCSCGDFW
ncbi:pentatricopeptide repeat-containing protein At3g24000, mitochondrial [Cryptomeria japonica]|uniref:pentatricopeptide repeat-containing protein At3g24000, mitochondrial n=1 Tax=Cryptomeria japonica TaxID=3369 RepID=UPI0025AD15BD|nr:pentatricopeptide repeat-containing protein At3g24000, mitochondrial [Cryptomeria japonica]